MACDREGVRVGTLAAVFPDVLCRFDHAALSMDVEDGGLPPHVGSVEEVGDDCGGIHPSNDDAVGEGYHPDSDIVTYDARGTERKRVGEFQPQNYVSQGEVEGMG